MRIPQQRMGRPDEVADAVAWLATRASYVNGLRAARERRALRGLTWKKPASRAASTIPRWWT